MKQTWREVLPIHPAAELFPLASRDELITLANDIKENRLKLPVILWSPNCYSKSQTADDLNNAKNLNLLDGRNRLDALELNGVKLVTDDGKINWPEMWAATVGGLIHVTNEDPYKVAISANIHRRHLTAEQKRDLIVALLKAQPQKSNRRIAKEVGASHPHVAKLRHEAEKTGDVETVTTSVDSKGRKQPARKAKPKASSPPPKPDPSSKPKYEQRVYDSPQEAHAKAKIGKPDYEALEESWAEVRDSWVEFRVRIKGGALTRLRETLELHRDKIDHILQGLS